MSNKAVVSLTTGLEDAERVTVALLVAVVLLDGLPMSTTSSTSELSPWVAYDVVVRQHPRGGGTDAVARDPLDERNGAVSRSRGRRTGHPARRAGPCRRRGR